MNENRRGRLAQRFLKAQELPGAQLATRRKRKVDVAKAQLVRGAHLVVVPGLARVLAPQVDHRSDAESLHIGCEFARARLGGTVEFARRDRMKVATDLEQPEITGKAGGKDENENNNMKLPYFHGALLACRLGNLACRLYPGTRNRVHRARSRTPAF